MKFNIKNAAKMDQIQHRFEIEIINFKEKKTRMKKKKKKKSPTKCKTTQKKLAQN